MYYSWRAIIFLTAPAIPWGLSYNVPKIILAPHPLGNSSGIPRLVKGHDIFRRTSTSDTADANPPMRECSSHVTSAPVSLAALTIVSSSSGLSVWQLKSRTLYPSFSNISTAVDATGRRRPVTIMAASLSPLISAIIPSLIEERELCTTGSPF